MHVYMLSTLLSLPLDSPGPQTRKWQPTLFVRRSSTDMPIGQSVEAYLWHDSCIYLCTRSREAQSQLCGLCLIERTFGRLAHHVLVSLLFMTACFTMEVLCFFHLCVYWMAPSLASDLVWWCPHSCSTQNALPRGSLCKPLSAPVNSPFSEPTLVSFTRDTLPLTSQSDLDFLLWPLRQQTLVSWSLDTSWTIRPGVPPLTPELVQIRSLPRPWKMHSSPRNSDRNNLCYFLETLFGQSREMTLWVKCFLC